MEPGHEKRGIHFTERSVASFCKIIRNFSILKPFTKKYKRDAPLPPSYPGAGFPLDWLVASALFAEGISVLAGVAFEAGHPALTLAPAVHRVTARPLRTPRIAFARLLVK